MGFFRKKSSNSPPKSKNEKTNENQAISGEPSSESGPIGFLPPKDSKETRQKKNEPVHKQKDGKEPSPKSSKEKRDKSPTRKIKKEKKPKSAKEPRRKSPKTEKLDKSRWVRHSKSPTTKKEKSQKVKKDKFKPSAESLSIVHPAGDTGAKYPDYYFRDGIHKVDFILVTTKRIIQNPVSLKFINNYVENLKPRKLLYEFEHGKIINNLFFIKISVSDSTIKDLATEYHINLTYTNPNYDHDKIVSYKFLQNHLNAPYLVNPIYSRSSSVSGDRPSYITDAERSMIAYKVLAETSYGKKGNEFGHIALIKQGIFIDAYPLHDHSCSWTKAGPVSDRQLLRKYWASFHHIFKIQPLNLIEKYFGTDNAFYFAWVGFYIKMLTIAGILGLVFFIAGMIYYTLTGYKDTLNEVCKSDIVLCPACKDFKVCKFIKLKDSCDMTIASNYFDNNITILFAIIMSLWSTLFMIYWKRYESKLSFRWNVRNLAVDTTLRYEYLEVATEKKRLPNGEPYVIVPKVKRYCYIILTYSTCIFLVVIVIAILFGYIIYRVGVRYTIYISNNDDLKHKSNFIISISSSIFIYCFIAIFGKIYESVALILTRYEYHRTELEHDNSYVYKMAALSFANNYAAITYLAFFKGKFYTHPGNTDHIHYMFGLGEDLCDPAGCLIDLTIQLASIMISRNIVSLIDQFAVPYLKYKFNKLRYHKKKNITVPHWEEEFCLSRTSKYYLIYEWTSMLIQYGFVTFYVAALPLAPIIAWLNNIFELRIDAIKMVTTSKRPVAHRTSGIGPYKGVLKAMTITGIATNAFVLAFTTDFIPRFMYAVSRDTGHYRRAKLSRFAVSDFPNYTPSGEQVGLTECYYPGNRHPPGHEKKYTLNEGYWQELAVRFAFVLLFEHILVTFTGILAYVIPKQSLSLKLESNKQEIAIRQAKNAILNEEREKHQKKRRFAFRGIRIGKSKDPSMA